MSKLASPLPTPLSRAAQRFEEWRRNRTTHGIPAELWSLAADLGARFGVSRTARALRVQYYALKKRIDNAAPTAETDVAMTPTAFVEIRTTPTVEALPGECRIEFEMPSGEKMRIHMKGAYDADLGALAGLFLGERT